MCSQDSCTEGEDTAGTTAHSPTRAHFGFLDLGGCDAAGAFSVRSWVALRASGEASVLVPELLGMLQDWDHTEELMEPS